VGFWSVLPEPSPKVQFQLEMVPGGDSDEWSVNWMVVLGSLLSGVKLNEAEGAALTWTVWVAWAVLPSLSVTVRVTV